MHSVENIRRFIRYRLPLLLCSMTGLILIQDKCGRGFEPLLYQAGLVANANSRGLAAGVRSTARGHATNGGVVQDVSVTAYSTLEALVLNQHLVGVGQVDRVAVRNGSRVR